MTSKLWTGSNGSDYTNGNNWNPNVAPGAGDVATFGSGAANKTVNIPAGPVLDVDEWLFNGGAYTLNVSTTNVPTSVVLQGAGIQVTAGSAFISVLSSGDLVFQNHSSAGNATIAALSGGVLTFTGNSDGGTARFITNASGFVDFSGSAGALGDSNVNAGSIEGAGNFHLGADQLTVGSNNLSTVVSGSIFGSFGSALTKVGTGTLTLAGNNGFTGGDHDQGRRGRSRQRRSRSRWPRRLRCRCPGDAADRKRGALKQQFLSADQ